jgi:selenoprotein W-related protein
MTAVEIEYCVPCGFLVRAESVQHLLLQQFGQQLERVALVTGDDGVFTVSVDGERVWDKSEDEFDPDLILRRVKPHLRP